MKAQVNSNVQKNKKDFDDPYARLTKIQKYQLIESMLNESFPLLAIIFVIFVDVVLALCSIGFQIVAIVLQTELSFIGCG